jgi:hypothetical protein
VSLDTTDPAGLAAAFTEALNAGDIDGVLKLFAPDAAIRTSEGIVISGPGALCAHLATTVAGGLRLLNSPRHVIVGNGAVMVLVDWVRKPAAHDDDRVTSAGIARQDGDGCWQFTILNRRDSAGQGVGGP